ncbi:MAG: hypothetical protein RBG13Loki_1702 [Promethearchaeota archaeon CR_4]|nr:MAG: hypothetical protein RBG13Loki_1702 [Candidatus Lokiarchaeota archaeon CR_4]
MPRKKEKPSIRSYFGDAAGDYSSKKWMARNQHQTTRRALQLLLDPKLGPPHVPLDDSVRVIDITCGSGFSSDILAENDLHFTGADLSLDMLGFAARKGYDVVQSDMRFLPFRDTAFAHGISISGLNFVTTSATSREEFVACYTAVAIEFARVIQEGGRYAVEFYPSDDKELKTALSAFKRGGFRGFLVVDHPGHKKEQKFLALEKESLETRT